MCSQAFKTQIGPGLYGSLVRASARGLRSRSKGTYLDLSRKISVAAADFEAATI